MAKVTEDMVTALRDTITIQGDTPTISKNKPSTYTAIFIPAKNGAAAAKNDVTNATNQAEDAGGVDRKTKNSPCRGEQDSKTESVPVLFL